MGIWGVLCRLNDADGGVWAEKQQVAVLRASGTPLGYERHSTKSEELHLLFQLKAVEGCNSCLLSHNQTF